MDETALDTVQNLLESSIEETEDPEITYKLRTASQLLDVIQNNREKAATTLEGIELDQEPQEQLRELGYIE